eukprot:Rmarinus@m.21250
MPSFWPRSQLGSAYFVQQQNEQPPRKSWGYVWSMVLIVLSAIMSAIWVWMFVVHYHPQLRLLDDGCGYLIFWPCPVSPWQEATCVVNQVEVGKRSGFQALYKGIPELQQRDISVVRLSVNYSSESYQGVAGTACAYMSEEESMAPPWRCIPCPFGTDLETCATMWRTNETVTCYFDEKNRDDVSLSREPLKRSWHDTFLIGSATLLGAIYLSLLGILVLQLWIRYFGCPPDSLECSSPREDPGCFSWLRGANDRAVQDKIFRKELQDEIEMMISAPAPPPLEGNSMSSSGRRRSVIESAEQMAALAIPMDNSIRPSFDARRWDRLRGGSPTSGLVGSPALEFRPLSMSRPASAPASAANSRPASPIPSGQLPILDVFESRARSPSPPRADGAGPVCSPKYMSVYALRDPLPSSDARNPTGAGGGERADLAKSSAVLTSGEKSEEVSPCPSLVEAARAGPSAPQILAPFPACAAGMNARNMSGSWIIPSLASPPQPTSQSPQAPYVPDPLRSGRPAELQLPVEPVLAAPQPTTLTPVRPTSKVISKRLKTIPDWEPQLPHSPRFMHDDDRGPAAGMLGASLSAEDIVLRVDGLAADGLRDDAVAMIMQQWQDDSASPSPRSPRGREDEDHRLLGHGRMHRKFGNDIRRTRSASNLNAGKSMHRRTASGECVSPD